MLPFCITKMYNLKTHIERVPLLCQPGRAEKLCEFEPRDPSSVPRLKKKGLEMYKAYNG